MLSTQTLLRQASPCYADGNSSPAAAAAAAERLLAAVTDAAPQPPPPATAAAASWISQRVPSPAPAPAPLTASAPAAHSSVGGIQGRPQPAAMDTSMWASNWTDMVSPARTAGSSSQSTKAGATPVPAAMPTVERGAHVQPTPQLAASRGRAETECSSPLSLDHASPMHAGGGANVDNAFLPEHPASYGAYEEVGEDDVVDEDEDAAVDTAGCTRHGYRGVTFIASQPRPWRAGINFRNRPQELGFFESEEAAARAYDDAARRLHGHKARLNFPEGGERGVMGYCAFRGISWQEKCKKYEARLKVNGRMRYIGVFADAKEAAVAWDMEALRQRGVNFTPLNFPDRREEYISKLRAGSSTQPRAAAGRKRRPVVSDMATRASMRRRTLSYEDGASAAGTPNAEAGAMHAYSSWACTTPSCGDVQTPISTASIGDVPPKSGIMWPYGHAGAGTPTMLGGMPSAAAAAGYRAGDHQQQLPPLLDKCDSTDLANVVSLLTSVCGTGVPVDSHHGSSSAGAPHLELPSMADVHMLSHRLGGPLTTPAGSARFSASHVARSSAMCSNALPQPLNALASMYASMNSGGGAKSELSSSSMSGGGGSMRGHTGIPLLPLRLMPTPTSMYGQQQRQQLMLPHNPCMVPRLPDSSTLQAALLAQPTLVKAAAQAPFPEFSRAPTTLTSLFNDAIGDSDVGAGAGMNALASAADAQPFDNDDARWLRRGSDHWLQRGDFAMALHQETLRTLEPEEAGSPIGSVLAASVAAAPLQHADAAAASRSTPQSTLSFQVVASALVPPQLSIPTPTSSSASSSGNGSGKNMAAGAVVAGSVEAPLPPSAVDAQAAAAAQQPYQVSDTAHMVPLYCSPRMLSWSTTHAHMSPSVRNSKLAALVAGGSNATPRDAAAPPAASESFDVFFPVPTWGGNFTETAFSMQSR